MNGCELPHVPESLPLLQGRGRGRKRWMRGLSVEIRIGFERRGRREKRRKASCSGGSQGTRLSLLHGSEGVMSVAIASGGGEGKVGHGGGSERAAECLLHRQIALLNFWYQTQTDRESCRERERERALERDTHTRTHTQKRRENTTQRDSSFLPLVVSPTYLTYYIHNIPYITHITYLT